MPDIKTDDILNVFCTRDTANVHIPERTSKMIIVLLMIARIRLYIAHDSVFFHFTLHHSDEAVQKLLELPADPEHIKKDFQYFVECHWFIWFSV